MITETLKFVEDHTKNLYSDVQKVGLTAILIYLCSSEYISDHKEALLESINSHITTANSIIKQFETSDLSSIAIKAAIIWVAYQLIVVVHQSVLMLLHHAIPKASIRVYKLNTEGMTYVSNLRDITYKFYADQMDLEDFEAIFAVHRDKAIRVIKDANSEPTIFVKERLIVFLAALIYFHEERFIWLNLAIASMMTVFIYYNNSKNSCSGQEVLVDVTQRACLELVSTKLEKDIRAVAIESAGAQEVNHTWVMEFSAGWFYVSIHDGIVKYDFYPFGSGYRAMPKLPTVSWFNRIFSNR